MARQKRNPAAHELIKQMMAMYKPETMEDVHDMMKDMFSDTLEEMLHAELDAALGYEKHDQSPKQTTNRRNGSYPKTVRGELGETDTRQAPDIVCSVSVNEDSGDTLYNISFIKTEHLYFSFAKGTAVFTIKMSTTNRITRVTTGM